MQRTVAVLLGIPDVVLDPQYLNVVLSRQIVGYGIHVVPIVADHADAGHIEQVVLDGIDGKRQVTPFQLAQNGIDGLQTTFHMMDRIMREAYLELRIEDFQLGADLVHGTLIHLHLIDEFGDLIGGECPLAEVHILQSGFEIGSVDAALSVKYHGQQCTHDAPNDTVKRPRKRFVFTQSP